MLMLATSAQVCWGPSEMGEDHWFTGALLSPRAVRLRTPAGLGRSLSRGLWSRLGLKMLVSVTSYVTQAHIHMHTDTGPLAGLPGLANKSTFGFQVNSILWTYFLYWKNCSKSEIRVTVSGHFIWQSYPHYVWAAKPPFLCPTYSKSIREQRRKRNRTSSKCFKGLCQESERTTHRMIEHFCKSCICDKAPLYWIY